MNFFLGCVGVAQVTRIFMYRRSVQKDSVTGIIKEDAKVEAEAATRAVEGVETKAKEALK